MTGRKTEELFRQLAAMLHAGLPVVRALGSLERAAKAPLQQEVANMQAMIEAGSTFHEAACKTPLFSKLERSLIAVGERSGSLDRVLNRMADDREFWRKLRTDLISKFIYPCLVLHVASLAIAVIGFVWSGPSAAVAALVGILGPMYAIILTVFVVGKFGHRVPGLPQLADGIANALPVVGGVHRRLALARFSRCLAAMYDAGISVPDAVAACAPLCGSILLAKKLDVAVQTLRSGISVTDAFAATGAFDSITLGMIATGEETGRLDEMLNNVAANAEHEASVAIHRIGVLLPVFLMILLALFVGYIIITAVRGYVDMLNQF